MINIPLNFCLLKQISVGMDMYWIQTLYWTGLDAAGKTTILYKMKLGEVVTTIPTIGSCPIWNFDYVFFYLTQ